MPRPPKAKERERKYDLGIQGDRDLVRKVLAVGHEFDVNKGGLYDARSGCVNLWCSPEDKPEGWDKPITKGGFNYPRELVGTLGWDWPDPDDDNKVAFYIDASPYALLPERFEYRWDLIPDDKWENLLNWLRAQAKGLLRLAGMHETFLGSGCPFCDYILPAGELGNVLLDHIGSQHGEISEVNIGDFTIRMADGRVVRPRDVTDVRG